MKNSLLFVVTALTCLSCSFESTPGTESGLEGENRMGDAETRYLSLRERAVERRPEDQFNAFAFVYEHASQIQDHIPEAVGFLVASAEEGYVDAEYSLGFLLQTGRLVEADADTALHWFSLAAEKGHIRAQLWCGLNIQERYLAAKTDTDKAAYAAKIEYWLRKAISSDNLDASEVSQARTTLGQTLLGESIENEEGWQLLKEAARDGYKSALSTLYELDELLGEMLSEGYAELTDESDQLKEFLRQIESNPQS